MDFKYSEENYVNFSAKGYLKRFIDPRTDPTRSYTRILEKLHSFYENYVGKSSRKPMSLLEIGGGPCVYTLISAAKYVESITFSDYSENNLREIKMWKEGHPECHDWSKYVEFVVRDLEGDNSEDAVERRQKLLREKIKDVIPCNILKDNFFEDEYDNRQYDVVQTSGCFECVLNSREDYHTGIIKAATYIKPGGYMQLRTATGGSWYSSYSGHNFYLLNAAPEDNLRGIEMAGMQVLETFSIASAVVHDMGASSYQMTLARKKK